AACDAEERRADADLALERTFRVRIIRVVAREDLHVPAEPGSGRRGCLRHQLGVVGLGVLLRKIRRVRPGQDPLVPAILPRVRERLRVDLHLVVEGRVVGETEMALTACAAPAAQSSATTIRERSRTRNPYARSRSRKNARISSRAFTVGSPSRSIRWEVTTLCGFFIAASGRTRPTKRSPSACW